MCRCPQALQVLVTATVVGLLTGFLGVGGGFLVAPALLLAAALPMEFATGTSLVVITLTSAAAIAAIVGARLVARIDIDRLSLTLTGLILASGIYTATQAIPALV